MTPLAVTAAAALIVAAPPSTMALSIVTPSPVMSSVVPAARVMVPANRASSVAAASAPSLTVIVRVVCAASLPVLLSVRVPAPVFRKPELPWIRPLNVTSASVWIPTVPPAIVEMALSMVVAPVTRKAAPPNRVIGPVPRLASDATLRAALELKVTPPDHDALLFPDRTTVPVPEPARAPTPVICPDSVSTFPLAMTVAVPSKATALSMVIEAVAPKVAP